MELSIGGQQFHGKGRTRQAAKHDAAAKALKVLQNEPLPEKPEVGINPGVVSINFQNKLGYYCRFFPY